MEVVSAFREGATCVELGHSPEAVLLRESDDPTTVLVTTPHRLHALLRTVRTGISQR